MKQPILSVLVLACLVPPTGAHAQAQEAPSLEITFNQALQAMQAGRYPEAEQGLVIVLKGEPDNFAALGNLGVLYSRTHRMAQAISVDQRALRIDPGDPSLLLNLGLAYLKQEQYTQASTLLRAPQDRAA